MADSLTRALAYLERLPVAVSGGGGHNATLRAACECYRFGLTDAQALEAMQWFNQFRCQPLWKEHELRHKLADAARIVSGGGQVGKHVAQPSRSYSRRQSGVFVAPPPPSRRVTVTSAVVAPTAPMWFSDNFEEEARWLAAVTALGFDTVAAFDAFYDGQAATQSGAKNPAPLEVEVAA